MEKSYNAEYFNRYILRELKFSREYHFKKFHVYCNALFENNSNLREIYYYSRLLHIEKDHHVHIFLWNMNTDYDCINNMCSFIERASMILERPIYIHLPSSAGATLYKIKELIEGYKVAKGTDYRFIFEDFVHNTAFKWGDYAPMPNRLFGYGYYPNSIMFIEWNRNFEAASPIFISDHKYPDGHMGILRREIFKMEDLIK